MTIIDQLKAEIDKAAEEYLADCNLNKCDPDFKRSAKLSYLACSRRLLPLIEKVIEAHKFQAFYHAAATESSVQDRNLRVSMWTEELNQELLNTLKEGK